jgi:hypothetical protein
LGGLLVPFPVEAEEYSGFHEYLKQDKFYEECRLLGYKNTVRTSQETHYVSATEAGRLMLCNI